MAGHRLSMLVLISAAKWWRDPQSVTRDIKAGQRRTGRALPDFDLLGRCCSFFQNLPWPVQARLPAVKQIANFAMLYPIRFSPYHA